MTCSTVSRPFASARYPNKNVNNPPTDQEKPMASEEANPVLRGLVSWIIRITTARVERKKKLAAP